MTTLVAPFTWAGLVGETVVLHLVTNDAPIVGRVHACVDGWLDIETHPPAIARNPERRRLLVNLAHVTTLRVAP